MKTRLTACILFLYISAIAQNEEKTLDPVTITSSLIAKPVSQTGRNIVTIRGEEFSRLPVNSIDELLRYLPGIEIQSRGPMGSQSDIVLRGGTFQQVLVILDGVRLNDPNTGHFNSYIPIAPAEIDRIEILKGASSAIYGSEAVGGVINIITKTFAAGTKQPKMKLQGGMTAGEYDLINMNIGGYYQTGSTAIGGGWLSNNTKGQMQRGTRGFVYANTGSLSFSHSFNDKWQLAIRSAYDNRRFAAQNFYSTIVSDTASEKVETFWNQLRLSYKDGKHRVNLDAGWKSVTDKYLFNTSSIANESKSSILQATITDEWKLKENAVLINGVQLIDRTISSNDRGDHSVARAAAFIVWNQSIHNFTINPVLRVDWDEKSGTELVPQVNLSWKYKRLQLRGSAGKTIRDADFTERYNNYNKLIVTSGQRIGNPNLEAEHSFSYEVGADYFITREFKIAATHFQRFHRRLIDYIATSYADMPRKDNLVAGGVYPLAKNVARVNTSGAELDLQYNKSFDKDNHLYAGMGLLWLRSRSSDAAPSFYVSSHARYLQNFFIEYEHAGFYASVNGIYKQRSPQVAAAINKTLSRDYFVANGKLGGILIKKSIDAFIQINNIFNVNYSDLLGAQMPGRWLMAGIDFHFSK